VGEEATILHADADSFYASVEQRDDPSLRGKPVIVGGGVVLAASYEAKAFGVYTPMGEIQARRLCPQAIVVRPRMEAYSEASEAMFDVFRHHAPRGRLDPRSVPGRRRAVADLRDAREIAALARRSVSASGSR
jgi:nucleotidyltransferase/DNA polymerase involved in DNA repair